jgi:hypothetical protein
MTTYPTYTFTYAAIAFNISYINVYGGKIGHYGQSV